MKTLERNGGVSSGERASYFDHKTTSLATMNESPIGSEEFGVTDKLARVLEVFPDIQFEYALDLLEEEDDNVERVLEGLVDANGSYPKEKMRRPTNHKVATIQSAKSPKMIDYMSPSAFKNKPSSRYIGQSTKLLLFNFPFLNKHKVTELLESSSNRYAIAHDKICKTILATDKTISGPEVDSETYFDELLLTLLFEKSTVSSKEADLLAEMFCLKKPMFPVLLSSFRRERRPPRITVVELEEEIRFVTDKLLRLEENLEREIARRRARRTSILTGTAMTCACCYDEVAIEEMVACRDEGHLFCGECLSSYVETQIFANGGFGVNPKTKESSLEILCCHGDGCSSKFDRHYLKKALKPKVLMKYDELQYKICIDKAELDDMFSCPRCELMFEVPSDSNLFICPSMGCSYEVCRRCGEPPHVPLRCDEVEKKSEAEGRARVEEAATAAVVRCCPKCRREVIKSNRGCNKMKCGCGIRFCYYCEKKISGYDHFCQIPHCDHSSPECATLNKCPLYTNDVVEDAKARAAAARAEAAKSTVKVNLESILQQPPTKLPSSSLRL